MAVQLRLTALATNAGVPVTGLAGADMPEIEIWNADSGAVVQASTDGTEIAGGFYGFDFTPTAGVNYVALWDMDPAAAGSTTPQERFLSSGFSEFIDDIVPEGGSEDYGSKLQRLDAAITTRNSVVPLAAATDQAEHDQTQTDIAGLNDLSQAQILSDATPFAGADIAAILLDTGITLPAQISALVVPLAAATDQAEHDATQALIVGLNNLTALQVEDAVWDAAQVDHVAVGTFGLYLGTTLVTDIGGIGFTVLTIDAKVDLILVDTGTTLPAQIAALVVPMAAALSQTEHDATQTLIGGLNDLDAVGVENAVWDAATASHVGAGSFGLAVGDILTDTATTIPALIAALDDAAAIADAVWLELIATHDSAGTAAEAMEKLRKLMTNRATVSLDDQTVTIFEDDDVTPAFSFTIAADLRTRTPV